MNDHDDLHEHRLARELRTAAQHIELTPGNELAVVTRGRRRQVRRRRATGFALVATLGAGTALGVQQLARTGDNGLSIDQPDVTTPSGSVPSTTLPGLTDPLATAPPVVAPEAPEIPEDVAAAQLVEPIMEWRVVEPDSTQAVGFTFGRYGGFGGYPVSTGAMPRVPGVFVSSAPGRSENAEPAWWRTEDGITWEQVDFDVPIGRSDSVVVDGSAIYNIGTAPGIAAGEPNPLVFASSPDEGATWQQVELPLDTNEGRGLPLVNGVGAYAVAVPYDGGVVVLATRNVNLDWEELGRTDARIANGWFEWRPDGLTVPSDPDCMPVASTVPVGTVPGAGSAQLAPLVPMGTLPPATVPECGTELVTWGELGLPPETLALMTSLTTRAFRVAGDTVTEFSVPAGAGYAGEIDGRQWLTDPTGAWYEVTAGGDVVASEPPVASGSWFGQTFGSVGGVTFTSVQTGGPLSATRDLVLAQNGDEVTWTDWTALYPGDAVPYRNARGTTDSIIVGAVNAQVQEAIREGGGEVSGGGLTIRRGSMRVEPTFVLTESGEEIPLDRVRTDMNSGDVVVVDGDGDEVARMSADDANSILYGGQATSEWYVETSADGRNVSVERIAPLLGVDVDDADISSVPRISTDGTNVIIAVTMRERNADGVPKQLVLVGTPRT